MLSLIKWIKDKLGGMLYGILIEEIKKNNQIEIEQFKRDHKIEIENYIMNY
jgi:hypothetical protein